MIGPSKSLNDEARTATIEEAVQAASRAEVCLLALGEPREWTGENASRARLSLTGRQQQLLDAVAEDRASRWWS